MIKMDQPEQPTGQATEPEEPEETIEKGLLRERKKMKDGTTQTFFTEASHMALPSCELQIVEVAGNGQIIKQTAIKGTGHTLLEACQSFDHAVVRIPEILKKLYKKEKGK